MCKNIVPVLEKGVRFEETITVLLSGDGFDFLSDFLALESPYAL